MKQNGIRGLLIGVLLGCAVGAIFVPRAHGTDLTAEVSPVGVWKVVDYTTTDPVTGEVRRPFGPDPIGSAIYTAKGRMNIFVTGSHRTPATAILDPALSEQRAALFDRLYAYTGTYTVKGDQVSIHIESAWIPDWVGTDKTRTLKLDHNTLSIVTPPMKSPVDGRTYISTTTFSRLE